MIGLPCIVPKYIEDSGLFWLTTDLSKTFEKQARRPLPSSLIVQSSDGKSQGYRVILQSLGDHHHSVSKVDKYEEGKINETDGYVQ